MEGITDGQLIEKFLKDCKRRRMSPHTIVSYRSSLNLFLGFLSDRGVGLLAAGKEIYEDYIDYLNDRDISYKTIENRLSTYNSFYSYCKYKEYIKENILKEICKHYLTRYKENNGEQRKLISVEEMARFIHLIPDIRDKTIVLLFAKTGIRRRELVSLDIDDINWENTSITLKPTNKRSNRTVYFDYETAMVLKRWLKKRRLIADPENNALFVSYTNRKIRLNRNGVGYAFVKWAEIAGLHDPKSDKLSDYFTPHCCRHWFTTHLRRTGMPREFIMELRGDKRTAAMDVYYHIDREELRKSYLGCIPQLGIM